MADDSSDEEIKVRIGDIPLSYYEHLPIIGYGIDGKAVAKVVEADALEKHIARSDDPEWWRTVTDHLNARKVKITDEMLEVIRTIRKRKSLGGDFDPYRDLEPETKAQISGIGTDVMPPKRRFVPSKWERMKIGRLARAIEKG